MSSAMQTTAEDIRPAKQERSRATRDRLLAAGFGLVETRDFDALSVAEIAAAAGCSVGAFYDLETAELLGVDPAEQWPIHFAGLGTLP